MSQAQMLLNSMETTMPTSEIQEVDNGHIIIDEQRFVTVPESLRRLGVQHDHNIETVTFDCPRYWDDHDMSKMRIYVNYLCPDGVKGQYLTTNLVVKYDTMSFDWVISNNVTQAKGVLSFLVCICKVDSNGNEERHWNSELNQQCYISEGLECRDIATSEYPDIITHLLLRMDDVEQSTRPEVLQSYATDWLEAHHAELLAEIENKARETMSTIPEDFMETAMLAKEGAQTKSDAIMCSAEGDVITVEDSSDDLLRGLTIFGKSEQTVTTGKNLANPAEILPFGFASNTSGLVLGYNETDYRMLCVPVTHGNVYRVTRGTALGSRFRYAFSNAYPEAEMVLTSSTTAHDSTYDRALSFTTTSVPKGYNYLLVYLTNTNSTEHVESTWYQVEVGPISTDYEPYTGGVASPSPLWPQSIQAMVPLVYINGRNLIPSITMSKTYAGVTFHHNSDGSITINGTATSYSSCSGPDVDARPFRGKTVRLLGSGTGTNVVVTQIRFDWDGGYTFRSVNGMSSGMITVPVEAETMHFEAYVPVDTTVENVTIYPLLTLGDGRYDYEPYKNAQEVIGTYGCYGIPVNMNENYTDSDGQKWACDITDLGRCEYTQNLNKVVFDGSDDEIWYDELVLDNTVMFRIGILDSVNVGNVIGHDFACSHFLPKSMYNADIEGAQHTMQQFYFRINKSSLETPDLVGFRKMLSEKPMELVYVAKDPVKSQIDAGRMLHYEKLRTNRGYTAVISEANNHIILDYNADTKTYLENLPKATDDQVQAAVDAWLEQHFANAEGVKF